MEQSPHLKGIVTNVWSIKEQLLIEAERDVQAVRRLIQEDEAIKSATSNSNGVTIRREHGIKK